jgi:hypothetical protein
MDWKNNPTEFKYKLSEEDSVRDGGIRTVLEFGVDGVVKYIRTKVKIDRSTSVVNNLAY